MGRFTLVLFWCIFSVTSLNAQLAAKFTAEECSKEIYRQGFDSEVEMNGWEIDSSNSDYSWHLDNSKKAGVVPNFSSINASSLYSMAVFYNKAYQNEILTSPEIQILPNSSCSFYACFDGVFVMWANLTVDVLDVESQTRTKMFDAFAWSQENGHERPKWLPFSFDLSDYANKKVKFIFTYKGSDGDDVLIDDFRVVNKSDDPNATVEIAEGNEVHFEDMSAGNPKSWEWTFDGGTPSVSTERNPVITYNKAGTYSVKLVVKDDAGDDMSVREHFVNVKAIAPVAKIKLPQGGYYSPYAGYYLPVNKDVCFSDLSLNRPMEWLWNLPGSSKPTTSEQSPVVSYLKEGVYDLKLRVSNVAGTDLLEYEDFIQAGGTQYIWNIEMDESDKLASIPLGWYGYYGGTNWLGMAGFAEVFDKPAAPGSISEVSVFFDKASTITPDAPVRLSIAKVDKGFPGNKIATATVLAKDLKYDEKEWLPTDFKFDEPVEMADSFFIVIEGIPNNSDDSGSDDIAIAATTTRQEGEKSTVYHLLEEWDDNDQPTGKTEWMKNVDEFLSFAIAPKFMFKDMGSFIEDHLVVNDSFAYWDKSKDQLVIADKNEYNRITVWTSSGMLVYDAVYSPGSIGTNLWNRGIYLVKASGAQSRSVQKVMVE